ncbi:MAG TPA: SIS domain-containing protein, partial [Candidatus Saccharimonadales bacterium]|nr:SIS domain-containing protein [Candidatus Saccharimonadales bacterium]
MLDDANVLKQRDPNGALRIAGLQYQQANFSVDLQNPDNDNRPIKNIVVAGMGGSALAALSIKSWLKFELNDSFEIVRTYDLPVYVGRDTLVIVSSYSGNTEETLSCLDQAESKGAQVAIITSGGK